MPGLHFHELVRSAWREFVTAADYLGPHDRYVTVRHNGVWVDADKERSFQQSHALAERARSPRQRDLDEVDPPAWFVREELGFAFEHGPSLMWTCQSLAIANARALKRLAREDVPDRVTYPRDFIDPRKRMTRDPRARRNPKPIAADGSRGASLSQQIESEFARLRQRYAT
jgi:hypothetical protein